MEAHTMKQSVNTHTFWHAFYSRQQNRLCSVKRADTSYCVNWCLLQREYNDRLSLLADKYQILFPCKTVSAAKNSKGNHQRLPPQQWIKSQSPSKIQPSYQWHFTHRINLTYTSPYTPIAFIWFFTHMLWSNLIESEYTCHHSAVPGSSGLVHRATSMT